MLDSKYTYPCTLHLEQLSQDLNTNQRQFWRWLKNSRGVHQRVPSLNYMNKVLSTSVDKARAFNHYFSSIFTKESVPNLNSLRSKLDVSRSNESVEDLPISVHDVFNQLRVIDTTKASGPDVIPGRLLKEGADWLAGPLTKLFNKSIEAGQIPRDWTRANVTPVFKKGNKHSPSNYRPVSLTSLVVKILERLIHSRITDFLDQHHKLSSFQHGFRRGHSCQTQLLATVHEWARSLDNRASTHVIFLDFSKAFDSVPHQKLLLKTENIGVRGNLLGWIKAFLTGREQRVLIDGQSSDWTNVSSGVPQGSVLGPLLFLIYVNDVGSGLCSSTRLFADDCTLYREVTSPRDCEQLQEDLNAVYRWTQIWQLSLNQSKCKVMRVTEICSSSRTISITPFWTGLNLSSSLGS